MEGALDLPFEKLLVMMMMILYNLLYNKKVKNLTMTHIEAETCSC